MTLSSRRVRIQEKKLQRNLLMAVGILILGAVLFFYAGLPLMAQIALGLMSFKPATKEEQQTSKLLRPPQLDPLPEATNSAQINISGSGAAEAEVEVMVNGVFQKKDNVDKDGNFLIKSVKIKEGPNTVSVDLSQDAITSSPSAFTITYKKEPPKIELNNPKDNDTIRGPDRQITLSGKTDTENQLYINDRLVFIDPNGIFNFPVSLNDGENKFKLKAIDDAGNTTEQEIKINYSP